MSSKSESLYFRVVFFMKRKLNLTAKKSLSVSCYVRLLETRQDSSGKVYYVK